MNMSNKIYVLLLCVSVCVWACDDDDAVVVTEEPQSICDSLDVLYTNDIEPLLADNGCSGIYCHGGGAGDFHRWIAYRDIVRGDLITQGANFGIGAADPSD